MENKVSKYFGNSTIAEGELVEVKNIVEPEFVDDDPIDQIPEELLQEPPEEIVVDMEFDNDNEMIEKRSESKAMSPAIIAAMLGSTMTPAWMQPQTISRIGREQQSEESKNEALRKAEEKRQRKAAKRMKEFK